MAGIVLLYGGPRYLREMEGEIVAEQAEPWSLVTTTKNKKLCF